VVRNTFFEMNFKRLNYMTFSIGGGGGGGDLIGGLMNTATGMLSGVMNAGMGLVNG